MNQEEGRVRWTPRKVLRAARHLQEATVGHYARGGPAPRPIDGHADAPDDDEPITEPDLQTLIDGDHELQRLASADRRVRGIASSYPYYCDRLSEWPDGARDRWRAMREAFAWRLRSLDETELAIVHRWPNGQCSTLRMELGLGLSHVREHLAQMREVREAIASSV